MSERGIRVSRYVCVRMVCRMSNRIINFSFYDRARTTLTMFLLYYEKHYVSSIRSIFHQEFFS